MFLIPCMSVAASISFDLDSEGHEGIGYVETSIDISSGTPYWTVTSMENLFVRSIVVDGPFGMSTLFPDYSSDLSMNYSSLDGYLRVYGDFGSDDGGLTHSSTSVAPVLAAEVGLLSFNLDTVFDPVGSPFRFSGSDIKDPSFTGLFGFPATVPWFFAMELPLIQEQFSDFDFGDLDGDGEREIVTLPTTFLVSQGSLVNTPVPEPGTMLLLGSGLVGLAGWGRKRFRR